MRKRVAAVQAEKLQLQLDRAKAALDAQKAAIDAQAKELNEHSEELYGHARWIKVRGHPEGGKGVLVRVTGRQATTAKTAPREEQDVTWYWRRWLQEQEHDLDVEL